MPKPVALSCGEPAGIGSEIALKAWQALRTEEVFFWMGDPAHLPAGAHYEIIDTPEVAAKVMKDALPVLAFDFPEPVQFGQPNSKHAPFVVDVLKHGINLVRSGRAAALCTLPIHKQALQDGAAFAYPGHTEFLAAYSGIKRPVMMLAGPELKVVPATIHIPLSDVPRALNKTDLEEVIVITHEGLKTYFQIPHPRIVVAGLNPHAGENGKFGQEDIEIIQPVIKRLQQKGLDISGPHSADTLFHKAARERYDAAVAMYHDQALIPIKTIDFDKGVNLTLGLPFIRTSPDHGTALDIAGQGKANPTSTIEAIKLAARLGAAND
ncbi:MAG: 4-hydroxythreonine-4-phosphate dehydrogenase PdxA [Rhodobacteraceae bacterium]|nr:4-hydroxythreonine-4-phosphate dehydrogenase PdxA [Paracoccaceae bacterium]